jgi:hypothetical protein
VMLMIVIRFSLGAVLSTENRPPIERYTTLHVRVLHSTRA